ncbi:MAG: ABC transporter ATP-binding protein [Acidimicrobiales bacterium]
MDGATRARDRAGGSPVIRTRALTKRFGDSVALDRLELEVGAGEVFGFLGPNGAGKTTTIRLLLDLLRPTEGSATVLGLDPRRDGVALRARIGYLPGDVDLPARLSGRSYLDDHAAIRGRSSRAEIGDLADRLGADLDRPMGELSLGNRRKVAMIDAFVHEPDLLVLDEPTGGLDPLVQQTFRAMAREAADAGRTVFLSSHVLDEVQHVADRVAVLRNGRLVAEDRVDALLARLTRTFRVRFAQVPVLDGFVGVPGVQGVEVLDGGAHGEVAFAVDGAVGPLLEALAPHHPLDLRSHDPDLEELFLGYYTDDSDEPRGAGARGGAS